MEWTDCRMIKLCVWFSYRIIHGYFHNLVTLIASRLQNNRTLKPQLFIYFHSLFCFLFFCLFFCFSFAPFYLFWCLWDGAIHLLPPVDDPPVTLLYNFYLKLTMLLIPDLCSKIVSGQAGGTRCGSLNPPTNPPVATRVALPPPQHERFAPLNSTRLESQWHFAMESACLPTMKSRIRPWFSLIQFWSSN